MDLGQLFYQLGMQQMAPQGGPTPGKPPTINPMEFDKRFAGSVGANPPQAYPVDDNAFMQLLIRRQQMIDAQRGYPNDRPLLGELAAPFPSRP